jgi:hypothetical protein
VAQSPVFTKLEVDVLTALEIEYPSDDAFLDAFEHVAFAPSRFHHRDHLRLAWAYVKRVGATKAETRVCTGIRHLARAAGAEARYHETLTRGWVRAVAHFEAHSSPIWNFDQFVDNYPLLLRRDLLLAHYHAETLASSKARARWTVPDKEPIPSV